MNAINTLQKPAPKYTSFDGFLATHGKEHLKQIVDAYDSVAYRLGKTAAAQEITKYFDINEEILNSAIKYVTAKEGRIIPLDEQKKDLEAKVKRVNNDSKVVVPIDDEVRNYGAKRQPQYEKPADVIPITRANGYNKSNTTVYTGERPPQRPLTYHRRLGKAAVASATALLTFFSPISGLVEKFYSGTRSAEAQYQDPKERMRKLKWFEEQQAKKEAGVTTAPAPGTPATVTPPPAAVAAPPPATVAAPVIPPKPVTLDDLIRTVGTLQQEVGDLKTNYGKLEKDVADLKSTLAQYIKSGAVTKAADDVDLSKYKWVFKQRTAEHDQFGKVPFKDLPSDVQAWYSLQPLQVKFSGDATQYFVSVKMRSSYPGSDKDKFIGAVKLDKWYFGLELGKGKDYGKERIIAVSKEVYDALKSGAIKPQYMKFVPNHTDRILDIYSSVNPERKARAVVIAAPPSVPAPPVTPPPVTPPVAAPPAALAPPVPIPPPPSVPAPPVTPAPSADMPGRIPYRIWHSTESAQGRREDPLGTRTELRTTEAQRRTKVTDSQKPFNIFEYYERTIEQAP